MFKKVPRNVWVLGIVSFFNDLASEMIYPIVPIFLTSVLGTPVAIVGLIEGVAEATASITKFFFGAYSDYVGKRKVFVTTGYSFAGVSKLLIALASTWPLVLFARFIDRLGKGLRTAARDSLLLENSTQENRGYIFGIHRALDSLGAVVGPLVALVLLAVFKDNLRVTFFFAIIPAVIAVFLLIIFVKEKSSKKLIRQTVQKKKFFRIDVSSIQPRLKLFLFISFLFALGNSADSFLLLRVKDLGLATTAVVLAYVLYNVTQTLFSTPLGRLADIIGARRVFAGGLVVFASVYFFFGIIDSTYWIWVLFPIYGIYIAATDGVSKAYISEFITPDVSGNFFGAYHMLNAVGNFTASFIGGVLWSVFSPSATFYYGSVMAAGAFVILLIFKNRIEQR